MRSWTLSGALDAVKADDKDEEVGIDIIRKAIEAPMRAIAQNAGFEGSVVVEKVKSLPKGEGLNCANGEYGNMIEMGVNDPVKVTRTALQSAASVAALILITEATINEIPKEGPDLSALAAGMRAAAECTRPQAGKLARGLTAQLTNSRGDGFRAVSFSMGVFGSRSQEGRDLLR